MMRGAWITGENDVFTHILIPTDGSELAGKAVTEGLALARAVGAKVTFVTALEPFHFLSADASQLETHKADYEASSRRFAGKVLGEAVEKAAEAGVPAEVVEVWRDDPHGAIIETAKARGCDLIAMASHGRRGVAALLLGSQATKVLTHSKVPVLIYR